MEFSLASALFLDDFKPAQLDVFMNLYHHLAFATRSSPQAAGWALEHPHATAAFGKARAGAAGGRRQGSQGHADDTDGRRRDPADEGAEDLWRVDRKGDELIYGRTMRPDRRHILCVADGLQE